MNRPLGLKIIAWFFIIVGVLGLIMLLFGLMHFSYAGQMPYNVVASVLDIVFGIGLLKVKKWAWFGAVILRIVDAIPGVIYIVLSSNREVSETSIIMFIVLIVTGAIIVYLLRKDIKKMFRVPGVAEKV